MRDNLMYTLCDMKNINIKYFLKNVHILARSDFIKLKMKFHSFSHEIPRESSGLSGRDMRPRRGGPVSGLPECRPPDSIK